MSDKNYKLLDFPKKKLNEMMSASPMVDYQHTYVKNTEHDKYSNFANSFNQTLNMFLKQLKMDYENDGIPKEDLEFIKNDVMDRINAGASYIENALNVMISDTDYKNR